MLRSTGQKCNFLLLRSLTHTYTHLHSCLSLADSQTALAMAQGLNFPGSKTFLLTGLPWINGHESHDIDFCESQEFHTEKPIHNYRSSSELHLTHQDL